MGQFADSKSNVHQERVHRMRLLGTGASAPTVEFCPNVTISRVSAGLYRITWADAVGTFMCIGGYTFGAATPGDVKGQTLTRDTFDTTNKQLDIAVWSSAFAADDLQATEYLDVSFVFAMTNSP